MWCFNFELNITIFLFLFLKIIVLIFERKSAVVGFNIKNIFTMALSQTKSVLCSTFKFQGVAQI
jgi:hypothetical protein